MRAFALGISPFAPLIEGLRLLEQGKIARG